MTPSGSRSDVATDADVATWRASGVAHSVGTRMVIVTMGKRVVTDQNAQFWVTTFDMRRMKLTSIMIATAV